MLNSLVLRFEKLQIIHTPSDRIEICQRKLKELIDWMNNENKQIAEKGVEILTMLFS